GLSTGSLSGTWTEGGWMSLVLGSSVSLVAYGSFSTIGGGIEGPSYEIPLQVVMALASFRGFGMNEKVKKKKEEEHLCSFLNRSLDCLNLEHLDRLYLTHCKMYLTVAIRKNRDEDIA
nr:hypothetical protein [Tanacetum cinerariifolium]